MADTFDILAIFNGLGVGFKWLLYGIIIIALIGLAVYVALFMRKPKKYKIRLWEEKADGKLHYIGNDVVQQKFYNFGKRVLWQLKFRKVECVPPPTECVYRLGKEDWADYLICYNHFIPTSITIKTPENWKEKMTALIQKQRGLTPNEINREWILCPLQSELVGKMEIKPLSYELETMRQNMLENLNKIWADRLDMIQKFLPWIGLVIVCIAVVFVIYFTYSYATENVKLVTEQVSNLVPVLKDVAKNIGQVTGIKAPPV